MVSTRKSFIEVVLSCDNDDLILICHQDNSSKEVIHPHLPVRIPCYDLTLIAGFTLVLRNRKTLGTPNFADLTGSVCKRRERIHRNLLICDYYQFRVHADEFQPAIPTGDWFKD